MKSVFCIALLLALVCVASAAQYTVNDDMINTVNSTPGVTWKAAHNKFSWWTNEEVSKILGTKVEAPHAPLTPAQTARPANIPTAIPASFDSRQQWPSCIHPIRDQAQCGSCWAFSASEVVSDRLCISSNNSTNVVMSPQYLVSCDYTNMGCDGGNLSSVWSWIVHHGIVADTCMPYTAGGGDSGTCPSACKDGSAFQMYKARSSAHIGSWLIFWKRVEEIATAISQNGPVQTGFTVYQDFMSYSSGVYKHTSGGVLGGHAVKIIGWGNENGTDYWLVANSWGTTWGLQGFFKILRGSDECGLEAQVYTGTF